MMNTILEMGKGWHAETLTVYELERPLTHLQLDAPKLSKTRHIIIKTCNQPLIAQSLPIILQTFPRLLSLNLEDNKLASLDFLFGLDSDNLLELRLCKNFLTSIRPLRKLNLPNLQFLALKENLIVEYDSLTEMKMSNAVESLTLSNRKSSDKVIKRTVAWIAKHQPTNINNFNTFLSARMDKFEQNQWDYDDGSFSAINLTLKMRILLGKLTKKYKINPFEVSNCYDLN